MAAYFFAMYLLGASLGPVGTGLLSDVLARRAGGGVIDEAARATGLHQALYLVPALSAILAAVLLFASRAFPRDRRALSDWMSLGQNDLSVRP
jgi:hypothetical protein